MDFELVPGLMLASVIKSIVRQYLRQPGRHTADALYMAEKEIEVQFQSCLCFNDLPHREHITELLTQNLATTKVHLAKRHDYIN